MKVLRVLSVLVLLMVMVYCVLEIFVFALLGFWLAAALFGAALAIIVVMLDHIAKAWE